MMAVAALGLLVGSSAAVQATAGTSEPPLSAPANYDPDAVFRYAYSAYPATFVPYKSAAPYDLQFLFMAYDRLVAMDENGELQPQLAESWSTPDSGTLVFEIRPGVTFHDGTALDAEAVKRSLEIMRGPDSTLAAPFATVASIEVTRPMEVTVTTTGGGLGALLTNLAGRSGMIMSPAALDGPESAFEQGSFGAGPYRIVENRPGDRVIYERFEDYWDPSVQYLAGAEFITIADSQARNRALEAGDVDMIHLSEDQIPAVEAMSNMHVVTHPSPRAYYIMANVAKPGLDNVTVRQAINYAFDRELLSTGLLGGLCTPTAQFFLPTDPIYDSSFGEAYPHDPDRARELLQESAIGEGEVSFTLDVANVSNLMDMAQFLQANLAEVGIDMQLQALEVPVLLERFASGESDAYMLGFNPEFDPSAFFASWYLAGGSNNVADYETPGIAELAEQALEPADMADRAPIYREMVGTILEDAAPPWPLCHRLSIVGVNDRVVNIPWYPHGLYQWNLVAMGDGEE